MPASATTTSMAEVLDRYGVVMKGEEKRSNAMDPRQCPNCLRIHAPTTTYCPDCGTSLTKEAMSERELIRKAFQDDPAAMIEMIREMVVVEKK